MTIHDVDREGRSSVSLLFKRPGAVTRKDRCETPTEAKRRSDYFLFLLIAGHFAYLRGFSQSKKRLLQVMGEVVIILTWPARHIPLEHCLVISECKTQRIDGNDRGAPLMARPGKRTAAAG
jgi:hypothetical protein